MATTQPLSPAMISYLQQSRVSEVYGVELTFFVVTLLIVMLRLLARAMTKQKLWWDDYLIIFAWVITVPQTALTIIMVEHGGLGRHIAAVGIPGATYFLKCLKAHEFLYSFVIGPAKISVLLYFWRIFSVNRTFILPFWILFTMIILWMLGINITAAAECSPFDTFWNRVLDPTKGHCINTGKFYTGVTVPNLITDGLLWALPIPYILGLQLSIGRKIGLICAFGVGSFVMVVSGLRLRAVFPFQYSQDISWDFVPVFIWTALEEQSAIICACLPSIAPLLRISYRHVVSVKSSTSSNRKYYDSDGSGPQKQGDGFAKLTDLESNSTPSQKNVKSDMYELNSTKSERQNS